MTLTDWQTSYRDMRGRAEAVVRMRGERIRALARAAGLDPGIWPCHVHNAWVSFQRGRPWSGVDYSLVRRIRRLERSMWEPMRVVERWSDRTFHLIEPR